MSGSELKPPTLSTNSAGQNLTDASQLDNHYRLAQPEYDACMAKVGIQPGWHVLDAGCGNGVFIAHIADAVGATGRVTAVDHAPEIMYLKEGVNGFIVPVGDIAQLASRLRLLMEDDSVRAVFSSAAKAEIEINGNIDIMCEGFAGALRFACRSRKNRPNAVV